MCGQIRAKLANVENLCLGLLKQIKLCNAALLKFHQNPSAEEKALLLSREILGLFGPKKDDPLFV